MNGIGVESQFKTLFDKEYKKLCQYAYTYMQDEHMAEDVVQDTFIKIWETKRDLISSLDIKFYLITAVRNNCITVLRKQKTQRTTYTDSIAEPEPEPFFRASQYYDKQNEESRKIAEALNQLPPKCKEVFLLIKLHGMSYKQAAQSLDISVKTIENQMGKAIKILREYTGVISVMTLTLLIKNYFSA